LGQGARATPPPAHARHWREAARGQPCAAADQPRPLADGCCAGDRSALVVFADQAGCPWLRPLRRGFRHCFAVLRAGSLWLACEPLKDRIELEVLDLPAEFDLPGFYGAQGYRVLLGQRRGPRRRFLPRQHGTGRGLRRLTACGELFMGDLSLDTVWSRYQRAKQRRRCWESLWRECYTYGLPQRGAGFGSEFRPGGNPVERLFDGTALDGVEQLGASLLAELTPPWSQWFGLIPGRDVGPIERGAVADTLDRVTQTVQAHFDRSNFAVEIHQSFLDLITVGSATLLFEEAPIGGLSAFRLSAVPMGEITFEAGPDGQIDGHFRERSLPLDVLLARFPGAELPNGVSAGCQGQSERAVTVIEAVLPHDGGFAYVALLGEDPARPTPLAAGRFESSPFISFRWVKGRRDLRPLAGHDRAARHQDGQPLLPHPCGSVG
jgi:Bacteriophage head to tail connecting protein